MSSAPPATGSTAPAERTVTRSGAVLTLIVTAYLMVGLDSTVVNVALPDIQRTLHFSPTGLSWVLNAYTLAFGGLLLLAGRAGDLLGRRATLTCGVLLFAAASLAGGLATDGALLLAARAAQGVGAALIAPSTLALITTHFPDGQARHRALAVYSSMAGIGASIGLVLGGALTDLASWRWSLLINVPIGVALALALPRTVRETPRGRGRFDVSGAVTGTAGMFFLVYAFIRVSDRSWTDPRALTCFFCAAALLAGFLCVEARARQPIAPLTLFKDRNRAAAYATIFLLPAGNFGAFYFLTLHIQQVLDYSPLKAGFAFLPLTAAVFVTVRRVPRLLARFGTKPLLITGSLLMIATGVWLSRLDVGDGYAAGLLGPMLLLGTGVGLSFMPLNATILAGVTPAEAGAASGLLQTFQWLGGTLGLAALVTVYGTATRGAHGSPDTILVHGATRAFEMGALIATAALLTIMVALKPRKGRGAVSDSGSAAGREQPQTTRTRQRT
ncbi:MFS transporter [Streptomyces sp. SID8379]|uniref:MFS transporter n=1 Tax=unclassified Streptomyces TaxID=2593676 RepID=UPI0003669D9A|nr:MULTISPECIES: MFS transporter [unclassified Streptomyces]MYW66531.1 MFS transporter [Streptomyces sp. SID8379]